MNIIYINFLSNSSHYANLSPDSKTGPLRTKNIYLHWFQGTAIWVKVIRDGKELPELIRDDSYDFNLQVKSLTGKVSSHR